ncbi:hypothetical protein CGLO_14667 [Colletotrichum gloeosporioides Cg-14]|uniref:Uncharacterized protein n=1 Tax=Colletotrichum gloeosporioides (strain Cg-14) TaxID=1237896 RepID=T0K3G8_COLGC|nr:hypothetical protein CGLO_14667 [Colletotrichum gloeosporioides Cg-14]
MEELISKTGRSWSSINL